MTRRPPRSTRTAPLLPDTTPFRSVSAAADLSRSLPRMRLVGESIYQKGSLSMHPIMAAPLLALSLAGLAVPAAAQPRDGASDGVERADAGDDFYCAERSEEHTSELKSLMRLSYAVF